MRRSRSSNDVPHAAPALLDGREVARTDPFAVATNLTVNTSPVQGNPFWSERQQVEAQLRNMRPASLPALEDTSAQNAVGQEDTGVLVPLGFPVSYGPQQGTQGVARGSDGQPIPPLSLEHVQRESHGETGTEAVPIATPSSGTLGRLEKGDEELIPDRASQGTDQLGRLENMLQMMLHNQAQFSDRLQKVEERSFGSVQSGRSVGTVSLGRLGEARHVDPVSVSMPPGLERDEATNSARADFMRPLESIVNILQGEELFRDALGTIWRPLSDGDWEWVPEDKVPGSALIRELSDFDGNNTAPIARPLVDALPGQNIAMKVESSGTENVGSQVAAQAEMQSVGMAGAVREHSFGVSAGLSVPTLDGPVVAKAAGPASPCPFGFPGTPMSGNLVMSKVVRPSTPNPPMVDARRFHPAPNATPSIQAPRVQTQGPSQETGLYGGGFNAVGFRASPVAAGPAPNFGSSSPLPQTVGTSVPMSIKQTTSGMTSPSPLVQTTSGNNQHLNHEGHYQARACDNTNANMEGVTVINGIPHKWQLVGGDLQVTPLMAERAVVSPAAPIVQGSASSGSSRPEVLGKHVLSLPTLAEYSPSCPTALGDWLAVVKPTLASLTDTGYLWWEYTYGRASQAYNKWLGVSPLERLHIQNELASSENTLPQHVLLEQRSAILLLQSIPESLKTDIVSTRRVTSAQILYKLLMAYQPGGAHERSTMLSYLVSPPAAGSVSEAIKGIRQWLQWRSRLQELHAAEPDATLLVRGLDTLVAAILAKHPTVLFRVSTYRERNGLDYAPTSISAGALAVFLQAELELLLHSAGDEDTAEAKKKAAKLAKAQAKAEAKAAATAAAAAVVTADGVSIGGDQGTVTGDAAKGKGKGKSAFDEQLPCWSFHLDKTCQWGDRCKFSHSPISKEQLDKLAAAKAKAKPKAKAKATAKAAAVESPTLSGGQGNTSSSTAGAVPALDNHQVLSEALDILKSLKLSSGASAKMIRMVQHEAGQQVGILDSAASHPMRPLRAGEVLPSTTVRVNLAQGAADMPVTNGGVLISADNVSPVVPLGIASTGFPLQLSLVNGQCVLMHPTRGSLEAWVQDGCVVVDRSVALDLIEDYEEATILERQSHGSQSGPGHLGLSEGAVVTSSSGSGEQASLRVARIASDHHAVQGVGLLDSGASHPLRSLRPGEREPKKKVVVALAQGKCEMRLTDGGTLVTRDAVDPLVPIGKASSTIGLRVQWRDGKCTAVHPVMGPLRVQSVNGCPCIEEQVALQLIEEMEQKALFHKVASVQVLRSVPAEDTEESVHEAFKHAVQSGQQDLFIQACWRWLRWYYPETPEAVLLDMLPQLEVGQLPFNRHKRRRLRKAKRVVVHLYSGGQRWHLPTHCGEVLEIDLTRGVDMRNSSVWTYVLSLALEGRIVAVISAPPCRSVSQLRCDTDGGPPVVRDRSGPTRFFKAGLDSVCEQLAHEDTTLFLKALFLYDVSVEARKALGTFLARTSDAGVYFALENPQDPALVGKVFSQAEAPVLCAEDLPGVNPSSLSAPSFFAWPEVRAFRQRYNMYAAHFDQGALGHIAVKPTTVMTSDMQLWESLEQVRVMVPWTITLPERVKEKIPITKSWFLWAPGLTKRIQRCLAYWLDLSLEQRAEQLEEVGARKSFLAGSIGSSGQHADQLEVDEASTTSHQACRAICGDSSWFRVAKLTKAEQDYKEHCLRGHIPFRKDCEVCVRSSGKDRRHLRQKYGHGYTLSLDLGGPYLKGKDLYQDQRHVLIGTYQFPILDKPEVEDGYSIPDEFCAEGPVDDDVVLDSPGECASETEEVPEFEIRKVMESEQAWKELKDHATTPVRMVNFMMAEPIASKQKSDVLSAVQRMTIKLQRHGYPLLRIHSDRGGEFVNKGFRTFCEARQIYRTTGDPGSPQTNGRSEATVGVFKRGVRALLKQAGLEPQYWARAAVQWAALRWRWAEQQLGLQPDAILPFGAKVRGNFVELMAPNGGANGLIALSQLCYLVLVMKFLGAI